MNRITHRPSALRSCTWVGPVRSPGAWSVRVAVLCRHSYLPEETAGVARHAEEPSPSTVQARPGPLRCADRSSRSLVSEDATLYVSTREASITSESSPEHRT